MKKDEEGFGAISVLLIVVLVVVLIAVGWYVWRQSSKEANTINSFESCVAAGNPIMESYPEQCIANGKTFTNPKQAPQEPPTTISQGVKGTITIRSGNCMPAIEPSRNSCSVEVFTTPSEVIIKKSVDPQDKENKEVVKRIDNVEGYFELELQPGTYNMYVQYNGAEYCNLFGGQKGEDCEFTVTDNKVTNYELQINNAAD